MGIRRINRPATSGEGLPDALTAIATLSTIAGLVIVHRAILATLLTARLVCRETYRVNRSSQDRKQNFETILYTQPSLASVANASGKHKNARVTRQARRLPYNDSSGSLSQKCRRRFSSPQRSITQTRRRTSDTHTRKCWPT